MGGSHIIEQELHSGKTQINHTLLTFGVMAIVIPAAFFAALDRGSLSDLTRFVAHLNETAAEGETEEAQHPELGPLLTDARRGQFLKLSRGMAVLLLTWSVHSLRYVSF